MSKALYDEAIADVKLLRETAEQNAKNAIIEAVTPKIRSFIEDQLLGNSTEDIDESDLLQEVASQIVGSDENVVLDESALMSLLEIFSGENLSDIRTSAEVKNALSESFNSLNSPDRKKLLTIANKLKQNSEFLGGSGINNDVRVQKENLNMTRSRDILYEIDLDELSGMTSSVMHEKDEEDDVVDEDKEEVEVRVDEEELYEIMRSLGLNNLLKEDKIEIDLGDVELPDDIQLIARVLEAEDDEDVDVEVDVDVDEEEGDDDESEDVEMDFEEEEDLDEMYEIDENVLRSELRRLRGRISEAKELIKIKGIKNDMAHSWGGKGDSKTGVKGAYGGTGKGGGDDFGGGKRGGDPLKVTLNKLSEAVKSERRMNRSLKGKLNEYRSAVETLREQLTDLNLFNAKLLYVNKLLQNKDVSSSQRRAVVESIDNAKSLREVKLVYKTLTESFNKGNRGGLRESVTRRALGSSSRRAGSGPAQSATAEVNRWAKLAGIKK